MFREVACRGKKCERKDDVMYTEIVSAQTKQCNTWKVVLAEIEPNVISVQREEGIAGTWMVGDAVNRHHWRLKQLKQARPIGFGH